MSSRVRRTTIGGLAALVAVLGLATMGVANAAANPAYLYENGVKITAPVNVAGESIWVMKSSLSGTAYSLSCNTKYEGTVENSPTAIGFVSSIGFGKTCVTEIPGAQYKNCKASISAQNVPWSLAATYNAEKERFPVTVTGIQVAISFGTELATPLCPLDGVNLTAEGSLEGTWNTLGIVNFEASPGITVYQGKAKVGTATVTDSMSVEPEGAESYLSLEDE
jgi:hypothetical protein